MMCLRPPSAKKHNVVLFKLKEKPLLEAGDFEECRIWADAHKRRTPTGWITSPHAIIDNKSYQITNRRKGREFAARRLHGPRTVPVRSPYGPRYGPRYGPGYVVVYFVLTRVVKS